MQEYILAIDQGTSTTRAIIIDRQGNYIGTASQKFEQLVPQSGWVEQDPNVIWQSVCTVIHKVMEGLVYHSIKLKRLELQINAKHLLYGIDRLGNQFTMPLCGALINH